MLTFKMLPAEYRRAVTMRAIRQAWREHRGDLVNALWRRLDSINKEIETKKTNQNFQRQLTLI